MCVVRARGSTGAHRRLRLQGHHQASWSSVPMAAVASTSHSVQTKPGGPPLDIEVVMSELGVLGRYQLLVLALLLGPIAGSAVFGLQYVFNAAATEHRCLVPQCETPASGFKPGAWGAWALPPGAACERYRPQGATCSPDSFTDTTQPCEQLVYANDHTIVSTFGLGCAEFRRTLVGSVHVLGLLSALPVAGYCSDRWGRRTVLLASSTAVGVVGLARSFVNNYYWYLALEFTDSAAGSGVYTTGYILALELLGPRWRVAGGNLLASVYALGQIYCAGVAWAVPTWRSLTRLLYAPALLSPLLGLLLPESVRWLLTQGRLQEAKALLLKAEKVNGRELSPQAADMLTQATVVNQVVAVEVVSCSAVLRSRVLLPRLLQCCWWFLVAALVYYGLSISAAGSTRPHLTFALTALAELPGYALSLVALQRWSRSRSIAAAYGVCGLVLFVLPAVPSTAPWATTLLSMVGKLCISMAFSSIYIFSAELFPTAARHRMVAACSTAGRIGSLLATLTPLLAARARWLPPALFGALALSAGALVLRAPDTRRCALPDTIAQAEELQQAATNSKQSAQDT